MTLSDASVHEQNKVSTTSLPTEPTETAENYAVHKDAVRRQAFSMAFGLTMSVLLAIQAHA
jgi:hypothetical protein